ncbi:MAG TPA: AAA family ATPase, partial [Bacteroidetes bacterium]|nr:AAA family ATPase [Bacteroidota bacterium]
MRHCRTKTWPLSGHLFQLITFNIQKMKENSIKDLIQAGAKLIQVISYETARVHAEINDAADSLGWNWFVWNRIEGLRKWDWNDADLVYGENEEWKDLRSAEKILNHFAQQDVGGLEPLPENSILILEDFHYELNIQEVGEKSINTLSRLRNIAFNKPANKALILLQPNYFLPKELEKEVQLYELPYPEIEDVKEILKMVLARHNIKEGKDLDARVLEAALGMTISEVEIAFGKAIVHAGRITEDEIPIIIAEKESIIRKSGHLEYFHPKADISQVGGLENLKGWADRRYKAFGEGAAEYGLDNPKGILLLGIPGTGKSLFAKAIANQWQFPLLRLDMGKIFGGIVGESERNIREALKVAEALAPSILWVDEIEKGLSGSGSSDMTDGGTSARVLGTFLTWMQEKESPVFVVAT